MRDSEKKGIIILIIVSILIMSIIFIATRNKNKKNNEEAKQNEQVQTTENGIKQATSGKLQETKVVGDLEISDIQITEEDGLATITASVKNNSGVSKNEFPMKIRVLNQSGETIQEVGAYVGKMQADETRGINASVNMEISQIYDIEIEL